MPEPKRFFRVEEMHHVTDDTGVSHWIVASDICEALRLMADCDLGDAKRLEIVELEPEQAQLIQVHDGEHSREHRRYPLVDGPIGAHYSEEY